MLVTTYNRAPLLRVSLERLCELTMPDEVLVVDDGSQDETAAVVTEFANRLPMTYIYNHNPEPSICSMARNIGVKHALHEWIATSEPELFFLTDVLAQFEALHPEHPSQVISAGHVYFAPADWNPSTEPPQGAQEAVGWVAPYAALWYRPWLEAVGGWDEGFPGPWGWDDTDLLSRVRISGIGQYIATEVKGVHQYHGLGIDQGSMNEQHFLAKSYHQNEDPADVVANQGREWGVIRRP